MRLISVTSSRADIGILTPVWAACAASHKIELHLLVTGMHLAASAPPLVGLPGNAAVHKGGIDMAGGGPVEATRAMAAMAAFAGEVYGKVAPDAVLVVGDRLDMLPAAVSSVPFNVPLVHLHGGEITEGALDDRVRHAISKLAHFHCVSSPGAERRLIAMGEEAWRIRRTGAPGIDTLLAAPVMPRRAWLDAVGFQEEPDDGPLRLVTVHPETNAPDPAAPLTATLDALDAGPARPTLFTAPNSDPGGSAMRTRIEAFVAARPWCRFRETLGSVLYPNALRHADMMIGNSSSGIVEAGTFGLPVINIGDRQKGREAGDQVIHVRSETAAVVQALKTLGDRPPRFPVQPLYGDGAAGPRVAQALLELSGLPDLLRKQLVSA